MRTTPFSFQYNQKVRKKVERVGAESASIAQLFCKIFGGASSVRLQAITASIVALISRSLFPIAKVAAPPTRCARRLLIAVFHMVNVRKLAKLGW